MLCFAHLDFFAINLDQPLPEVNPDRGLGLLGELAGTEAIGEARLSDPRVPDHNDFEDTGPRRRKSGARQRAGEFPRLPSLRHTRPTEWTGHESKTCRGFTAVIRRPGTHRSPPYTVYGLNLPTDKTQQTLLAPSCQATYWVVWESLFSRDPMSVLSAVGNRLVGKTNSVEISARVVNKL